MVTRDLLTIAGLGPEGVTEILALSERTDLGRPLAGKGAALVFQKPSARTRNSTEMAVVQLGGHPVYIQKDEVGLDTRETAEDVARTLACYHAVIAARVMDHDHLARMADAVSIPVVNLLSDKDHPLQALADILTMKQLLGTLEGVKIAYVGDADNNVARSLAQACVAVGAELTLASPEGYALRDAPDGVRQLADPVRVLHDEGLVDLDRTMDVTYGLLDRMHNPRPVFNAVRCLNTILFATPEVRQPVAGPKIEGLKVLGVRGPGSIHWLLLPAASVPVTTAMFAIDLPAGADRLRRIGT